MRAILGISGKRGTGKSLLAKCLVEIGWRELSFASALKRRVREDFGLTIDQTDGILKEEPTEYQPFTVPLTPRDIMIAYGQFFRSVDRDFWVKQAWRHIEQIPANIPVVIPDVRFLNEVSFLKAKGAMIVRLERDPKLSIYKGEINDPSECELDNYDGFDMIVPQEANQFPEDLSFLAKRIQSIGEAHGAIR